MEVTMKRLTPLQKYRREIIIRCRTGVLATALAAVALNLSQRRVQQLQRAYQVKGNTAFVHGNTGRKPVNKKSLEEAQRILEIRKELDITSFGINFAYFTDLLFDRYHLRYSRSFVRQVLLAGGWKSPERCRKKKQEKIHLIRPPKERFGEMVQVDGSPYPWFDDGKKYTIHGIIDDATGTPIALYMVKNECLLGYLEATRHMLVKYGAPMQLYPDRLGVFFDNSKKDKSEQSITQYGRMMDDLGVDMFPAYSPQAKGRIERFWRTLKQRLPLQLALKGIKTVAEANEFLLGYTEKLAKRFARKPAKKDSAFVKLTEAQLQNLSSLLTVEVRRTTDNSGVFSFLGYRFIARDCIRKNIVLKFSHQDGFWVRLKTDKRDGKRYPVELVETNDCGVHMPEVTKKFIEQYFLRDEKAKYRQVYLDLDAA
jgi:hypothetical protein